MEKTERVTLPGNDRENLLEVPRGQRLQEEGYIILEALPRALRLFAKQSEAQRRIISALHPWRDSEKPSVSNKTSGFKSGGQTLEALRI